MVVGDFVVSVEFTAMGLGFIRPRLWVSDLSDHDYGSRIYPTTALYNTATMDISDGMGAVSTDALVVNNP